MSHRFALDVAQLAGVAGLIQTEKSVVSPLNFSQPPVLTTDQLNQLRTAGMIGEGDKISDDVMPALDALASAVAYARVHLSGPGHYQDYAIYFGAPVEGDASIASTPQGLEIEFPANPTGFMDKIETVTGTSAHKSQEWEANLPPLEALGLAVLIDQRRRAVLKAIAEDKPALPGPSDPAALAQAINATVDVPQWLVSVVKNLGGITLPVSPAQLQPALQALVDKGLAWQDKTQIFPAQAVLMLADRMLLVGNVVSLDAAHANAQGAVAAQRCMCLQTGLADVLHLEMAEGQMHLTSISTAQMVDMLEDYLSNAEAVPPIPLVPKEFYLAIIAGVGVGQTYPLSSDMTMGRGQDCDIHVLDVKASRHHAAIRKLEKGFELTDLGSTNGTYLNGEFVATTHSLKEGDVIAVGETQLKVMVGTPPERLPESEATVYAAGMDMPKGPTPEAQIPPEQLPKPEPEPMTPMAPIPPMEPIPAMQPVPAAEPVLPMAPPEPILPMRPPAPVPVEPEVAQEPQAPVVPEIPFEPIIPAEPMAPPPMPPAQEPTQPPPAFDAPLPPPPPAWGPPPVKVKQCPNCANEVAPEAKFCGVCGTRL